jgi:hypothetical protein
MSTPKYEHTQRIPQTNDAAFRFGWLGLDNAGIDKTGRLH